MIGLQVLASVLILAAALFPLIRCYQLARRPVVAIVAASIIVFLLSTMATVPSLTRQPVKTLAAVPRQVSDQEFVSSATCQACHPAEHASWHASYHRTMTQLATPEAVQAPFENVELALEGKTYRLSREGDEFWVEMPDPDSELMLFAQRQNLYMIPDVPTVRRRVVLVTGSHHLQHFWVASAHGQGLLQVPWEYHIAERRWIPFLDSHVIPPEQQRVVGHWNRSCITCHSVNGLPGLDPSTSEWTSKVAELGIACESCHGPGRKHVEHHRNPLNRYRQHQRDEPDPTIVNPARCSSKVSASICGQCHSTFQMVDADGNPDFLGYLTRGSTYRAGGDLASSVRMLSTQQPGTQITGHFRNLYWNENDIRSAYWPDGAVRVGGREYLGLLDTPCFLNGEMSCISCHSMHDSDPAGQMAPSMDTNAACVQCHETIGEELEAHTHHAADSPGSSCYNCHMPHTSFALLRAARSHRLDSPSVESSVRTGRPNACNLCHLDQTLAWTATHLSDWYGIESPVLASDEREVAASLLWLLRGDAAQRAVTAWNMGWEPAQQASGEVGWQAPFLAALLEDPYSVVRYVARCSLRKLPQFQTLEYDYIGPLEQRAAVRRSVVEAWTSNGRNRTTQPKDRLLLDADGSLQEARFQNLIRQRDDRPVKILE